MDNFAFFENLWYNKYRLSYYSGILGKLQKKWSKKMEQYEIIWEEAKENLKGTISPIAYESWITDITAVDFHANRLVYLP